MDGGVAPDLRVRAHDEDARILVREMSYLIEISRSDG